MTFTGTHTLLKASMRQDIRNIAPWIMLISVLSASSILAYAWIFPTQEERAGLSMALGSNPAMSLIFGPARDLLTADGFNAWRAGMLGAFFAGLMAILIVIRNSRTQEDSGQAELLASAVLGRGARLAVPLLMAGIASIGLGVVSFLLTWISGGGVASTAILAATFTASGLMFAAVAAVTAQLGSDASTASSLAVGILGVSYVLRGYIDTSTLPDWTLWLTPFGWLERTEPAAGNSPWPLLITLAFTAILIAFAFRLHSRRDFGQGLIVPLPGPDTGGIVTNVWGLAFRLNRGSIIVWIIAITGLGALFGNLISSMGDIVADNPAISVILAAQGGNVDLSMNFVLTILQIIALIAAVMGIGIVLRMYTEEINYRLEPLLAGSLKRSTYLASNALVAFAGSAIAMMLAGVAMGMVAHRRDESMAFRDVLLQAVATIPAVWVLVALALVFIGRAPSRSVASWMGVVATFSLTILGPTFRLPDAIMDISPLRHVPMVAAPVMEWSGLIGLGVACIIFLVAAFTGFNRRDIL